MVMAISFALILCTCTSEIDSQRGKCLLMLTFPISLPEEPVQTNFYWPDQTSTGLHANDRGSFKYVCICFNKSFPNASIQLNKLHWFIL